MHVLLAFDLFDYVIVCSARVAVLGAKDKLQFWDHFHPVMMHGIMSYLQVRAKSLPKIMILSRSGHEHFLLALIQMVFQFVASVRTCFPDKHEL